MTLLRSLTVEGNREMRGERSCGVYMFMGITQWKIKAWWCKRGGRIFAGGRPLSKWRKGDEIQCTRKRDLRAGWEWLSYSHGRKSLVCVFRHMSVWRFSGWRLLRKFFYDCFCFLSEIRTMSSADSEKRESNGGLNSENSLLKSGRAT